MLGVLLKPLLGFLLNSLFAILWVRRLYIVWVKVIRVTLKISTISAFRGSSHELAKSQDELQNSLTLQLPAYTPHVTFLGCTTHELSHEINFLSDLYQLNTKSQINPTKYKEIN